MGVYRVEIDDPGCDCGHGRTYNVIGPDDVAHSVSYGDEEEAESTARGFDHAYELGLAAGQHIGADDPWRPFAEDSLPPDSCAILVWDSEFDCLTSTYWMSSVNNLETAKQFKWSHWMRSETLMKPRGLPKKEAPSVPATPELPADTPTADDQAIHGKIHDESSSFDDDIPFVWLLIPVAGLLAHVSQTLL